MPGTVNLMAFPAVDGVSAVGAHAYGRWAWLARRIWPARCLLCGQGGHAGRDLCHACSAQLPWNHWACLRCALPLPAVPGDETIATPAPQTCGRCLRRPPPQTACQAAFVYGFPLDRLLPRLKFHRDLAAARLLAGLMAQAYVQAERPDAVLGLPLHPARLRRRGYDQALELARPLARELGLPLLTGVLLRQRDTAPQSRLDAAQRRRNLRDAFTVRPGAVLPAHVALVDDVMTTGATVHAAVKALRRAGVARVDAWVCARVP
ncbi:MAG: ComF family protein [Pseudomonadota bacterium]|nr:ComF family protein [Pseudomonadota bacterium]